MSNKPSLYVVEKKEVVILVVLFVLVTVLSFTVGVRYGESVGKKAAKLETDAEKVHADSEAEKLGGSLGVTEPAAAPAHGDDSHGAAPAASHDEKKSADAGHGEAGHGSSPGAPAAGHADAGHGDKSPEELAKEEPAKKTEPGPLGQGKRAMEKDSDQYLLNALKDSEIEPPGGTAPKDAKLPSDVKKVKAGDWVIQVGSHPVRSDAEQQVKSLRLKKIPADVLPPAKDKQGEWHRVVIGAFRNKRDAEKEAKSFKAKGLIFSYYVWRLQ